jgi:hypothetical protein
LCSEIRHCAKRQTVVRHYKKPVTTYKIRKWKIILTTTIFIVLSIVTGKLQSQDSHNYTMSSGGKLQPLQAIMDIRHYTIALDVDIDKKSINGYTEIDLILSSSSDTLLFDLTRLLKVTKIIVDNKEKRFVIKDDKIYILTNSAFAAAKHSVRIYYEGNPPIPVRPPWASGFTWTNDRDGNPFVNITCQGDGGKTYFPCKDHPSDEPNEGADLFITIPNNLSVAGPGLLQSVKAKKKINRATWHWKTNYTISNYCLVFNIGKYKVFNRNYTTCEGNTVPIELYILEQDTVMANKLIDIKERDTRILEKYFGEYPWVKEKIGMAEVPNSGMEHQTMITFSDSLDFISFPGKLKALSLFIEKSGLSRNKENARDGRLIKKPSFQLTQTNLKVETGLMQLKRPYPTKRLSSPVSLSVNVVYLCGYKLKAKRCGSRSTTS